MSDAVRPPSTREHHEQPDEIDLETYRGLQLEEQAARATELDGVEIVHRRERFPVPGTKAEKRAERAVAACFVLAFLGAVAFVVCYVVLPWQYDINSTSYTWFTPVLGVTMALSLIGFGVGAILWAKLLITEEETVQERHSGRSTPEARATTVAVLTDGITMTGLARRSLLQRTLGLSVLALGALAIVPLGGLIKKPRDALFVTSWSSGVRLMNGNRRLIRPADIEAGGIETVFPATPDGLTTQVVADSVVLLIRLRPGQTVHARPGQEDFGWEDYVAYSKICTHAGCPASLYEQQTGRLLCPCHQSQFDLLQDAKPIFGPAARPLPKLAITVDDEGYFVAKGDFTEPIGPSFWERK
ncbi:MAG TPA: Rieske 2Fe-2S domain-containing protein [Mycobacteriales bacterium]|nr:Rieske 2Fe-2S domain-containing protein [Mycobacteriales bacterium]